MLAETASQPASQPASHNMPPKQNVKSINAQKTQLFSASR
ncbi:hypothetical protein CFter6_1535 [Collimonas fungivorans]|uniref:Uncharacterized protein n=1 Tax=Collimonas fungivorans TaxID=158899 RepID=A0A127P8U1_9BURK|nr:hypothetical protein CFter6_1535 [Collimonas fungivorans]